MTQRLFARRTRLGDAAAIFTAYAADPEVTRYLTWKPHMEVEPLERYLGTCIKEWDDGINFRYELCRGGTDSPVGAIVLRPEGAKVSFGYVLAQACWGRGLMTEALRFLTDWALRQPGVFRAYAFCDVENPGSARVMEKVGMSREGMLRRWHVCPTISSEPRDCVMYAKVR